MADQELDKLLIKVDSELGNLDAIDKAIEQLQHLKDFGEGASKGVQQLAEFGKALKNFHGLGTTLKGLEDTAEGISRMIDILERLGGASKYTRNFGKIKKDLGSSFDFSKQVKEAERDLERIKKAIDEARNAGKKKETVSYKAVDTDSLRKETEAIKAEIKKRNDDIAAQEKAANEKRAKEREKAQKNLERIEKDIDKARKVKRTEEVSFTDIDALKKKYEEFRNIVKESKFDDATKKLADGLHKQIEDVDKQLSQLEKKSKSSAMVDPKRFDDDIKALKDKRKQLEDELSKYRKSVNEAPDEKAIFRKVGSLTRELEAEEAKLRDAYKTKQKGGVVEIDVEGTKLRIRDLLAELRNANKEISRMADKRITIPTMKEKFSFKEDAKNLSADTEAYIADLEKQRERLKVEIEKLTTVQKEAEHSGAKAFVKTMPKNKGAKKSPEAEQTEEQKRIEVESYIRTLEDLTQKLDEAQKDLVKTMEFSYTPEGKQQDLTADLEKKKADVQNYYKSIQQMRKLLTEAYGKAPSASLAEKSFDVEYVEEDTKRLEELSAEYAAVTEKIADLKQKEAEALAAEQTAPEDDGLNEKIKNISNMVSVMEKASAGVKALGELGAALQNFAELGTKLQGLENMADGINAMIDALTRLGQITTDATDNIVSLRRFGRALHEFDGMDLKPEGIDKIAQGLDRLSKVTARMAGSQESDFDYIKNIAKAFESFGGMGATYRNLGVMTGQMAKLISVLQSGKEVSNGVIRRIADEFTAFNKIKDIDVIANNLQLFSASLGALERSSRSINDTMLALTNGFGMAVDNIAMIGQQIPDITARWDEAAEALRSTGLLEELRKFKALNDTYNAKGNFIGGLANLLSVLSTSLGKLNLDLLDQIRTKLEELGKQPLDDTVKENLSILSNLADAFAKLMNAVKYADFDVGNNAISKLKEELTGFTEVQKSLGKFSFTLLNLKNLIQQLSESNVSFNAKPVDDLVNSINKLKDTDLEGFAKTLHQIDKLILKTGFWGKNISKDDNPVLSIVQSINQLKIDGNKIKAIETLLDRLRLLIQNFGKDDNNLKFTKSENPVLAIVKAINGVDIDKKKLTALSGIKDAIVELTRLVNAFNKESEKNFSVSDNPVLAIIKAFNKLDVNIEQIEAIKNALNKIKSLIAEMNAENYKGFDVNDNPVIAIVAAINALHIDSKNINALGNSISKIREFVAMMQGNTDTFVNNNPIISIVAALNELKVDLSTFSTVIDRTNKLMKTLKELENYKFNFAPLTEFITYFDAISIEHAAGVAKSLKSILTAMQKLSETDPEKLARILPVFEGIATALSKLNGIGDNNRISIRIDEQGAAHVKESLGKIKQTWEEFHEATMSAVKQIDVSGLFDFDAPLSKLRVQLGEAERSLQKWMREKEKAESKMRKLDAENPDKRQLYDSSNFQKAAYNYAEADKYILEYKKVIDRLKETIRTVNPLTIELRGDADAMARLRTLDDEYKKYQDALNRITDKQGEGGQRLKKIMSENPFLTQEEAEERLGEEMAILQEHLENIQAESIQVQQAFEGMERTAEGIAYQASRIKEELNQTAEEAQKAAKEMAKTTGQNFSAFAGLLRGSNNEIFKSVGSLFGEAGGQLGKLEQVAPQIAKIGGVLGKFAGVAGQIKLVVDVFKAIKHEMDKLTETLKNAVMAAVQFAKTMMSKVVGAFNAVAGAVKKAVSAVRSGCQMMSAAVSKLGHAIGVVASQFGKLAGAAKSAGATIAKSVLKVIPGVGTLMKGSVKSLGTLIKKSSILGGIWNKFHKIMQKLDNLIVKRALLAFLNELKQAFDDLAVYSSKTDDVFNRNISTIFSQLRRLANQWIAVFEPLINWATPMILQLIETFRTVGEAAAKFMAILTGQNYYLRAKSFYEDYAKSADKANKSTKNLTNSLDELNILSDTKSSENDSEIDPADMWEKVYVDGKLPNFGFDIHDILERIKDFLRNIPWDEIKEWLRDKVKKLVDILNEIIADKELWSLIGKTIGELINTLFEMIDEFVWGLDWFGLGEDILIAITDAMRTIDWDLVRHAVEGMARALAELLNGLFADKERWETIGDFIAHCINDGIVNALKSFAWYFDMGNMVDSLLLAINTALERIDWNQIYEMFDLWAEDLADAINTLFGNERFWKNLGDTIANSFNSIFYFLDDLASRIDFRKIGESLALGIEEALNSFDWSQVWAAFEKWSKGLADIINGFASNETMFKNLGVAISNALNIIIGALRNFIVSLEGENIGQRIGDALKEIVDAFDVFSAFELPVDAINKLAEIINGIWDKLDLGVAGTKVADALKRALENVNWNDIRSAVERSVSNIVAFMNNVFADKELWKNLGSTVGNAIDTIIKVPVNILWQMDWKTAGDSLGDALDKLLKQINFEEYGTKLGEAVSNILNGFQNLLNSIDFKDLGERVGRMFVNFFRGFTKEDVYGAVYALFEKFGDFVSGAIREMAENGTFYNIGQKIAAALTAAIAGLSNFLDKNANWIIEGIEDFIKGVVSYIDEHEKDIVKNLNKIIDKVCNIIVSVVEGESGLIHKLSEILAQLNLGEILGTIVGKAIVEWLDEMEVNWSVVEGILKSFGDFLGKIWEMVSPHLGELFTDFLFHKLPGLIGSLIGGMIGKKVGAAIGSKIGTAIGGAIGSALGPAGSVIGGLIGNVVGLALGTLVGELVSHLGSLKDVLSGFFEFLGNIVKGIGDIIGGIIDAIANGFKAIGDWFSGLFGGGDKDKDKKDEPKKDDDKKGSEDKVVIDADNVESLKKVITEAIKDAEPILVTLDDVAITKIETAFKNALGGLGGGFKMNSQGGDLGGYPEGQYTAQGLEDGLYGNKDKIDRWGVERAEAIIKGYSEKMEINSPSKVMERLGDWTGEGLYNGLAAWIQKLVALINQIADAIVNALKGIVDVVTGVTNLVSGALSGFGSILSGAGQGLANLGQKIGDFLSGKKESNVGDTVKKDIDDAVKYANAKLKEIDYTDISKRIAEEIKEGFAKGQHLPINIDKKALEADLAEIADIIKNWLSLNRAIFDPLKESFKNALLGMKSDARTILGEIAELFKSYVAKLNEALSNIGKDVGKNVAKNLEDATDGVSTEVVKKPADVNYGEPDSGKTSTITAGEDNSDYGISSGLEKYMGLNLLEEKAMEILERLCKLAIEHVGHVKEAIFNMIHTIPEELRRTFESANLEQSGVQDLFDDNPDDLLLELYAHWRFADAIVAAYNDALKAIEETTRLKCDVILSVWRQYIDKICALFEKINKAWESAFKNIKATIKKRMREIYNLFKTWMKKIYDLIHSMPNYWRAAMKLDGITNEELGLVYADFEKLYEKLHKLFDKIARAWRDMMRKFPDYASRYLNATKQKFIKFISDLNHLLTKLTIKFDEEMAKFPGIAETYLNQVLEKFDNFLKDLDIKLDGIASYFSDVMALLADIADDNLKEVCRKFDTHVGHIKAKLRSILDTWKEVMKEFPDVAEDWLTETEVKFKIFKNNIFLIFDEILEKWRTIMAQFPHEAELKLNDTVEKFKKFSTDAGNKLTGEDGISKKWSDEMELFPSTADGKLKDTDDKFKHWVEEFKKRLTGVGDHWTDTMEKFPSTADTNLGDTNKKFDEQKKGIIDKINEISDAWDAVGGTKTFTIDWGKCRNGAVANTAHICDLLHSIIDKMGNLSVNCNCGGSGNDTKPSGSESVVVKPEPNYGGGSGGNSGTVQRPDDNSSSSAEASSGSSNGNGLKKKDITDAIKDAADEIAKKIADKIKPNNNSSNGNNNDNDNGSSNKQNDKQPVDKKDITDAIKDAADEVAKKIKEKLVPNGNLSNGTSNPNNGSNDGNQNEENQNGGSQNNSDNGIEADDLDDIVAKGIEQCFDPSGEFFDKGSVKAIYHDLVENIEPWLHQLVDNTYAIYHLLKRSLKQLSNLGDLIDKINELIKTINDTAFFDKLINAMDNATNKLKEAVELLKNTFDQTITKAENLIKQLLALADRTLKQIQAVADALNAAVNALIAAISKMPEKLIQATEELKKTANALASVINRSTSLLREIENNFNSLLGKLVSAADKLSKLLESNVNISGGGSNKKDYTSKLDEIISLLKAIRDKIGKGNTSSNASANANSDSNGNGSNSSNSSSSSSGKVNLSKIEELLRQIRDKIPANAGTNNTTNNSSTSGKKVDLSKIENLLDKIYKKIPTKSDSSKKNNEFKNALDPLVKLVSEIKDNLKKSSSDNVTIDLSKLSSLLNAIKNASTELGKVAEKIEKVLTNATSALKNAAETIKNAISSIRSTLQSISTAASIISSAMNGLKQAAYDLKDWIERLNGSVANNTTAVKELTKKLGSLVGANSAGNSVTLDTSSLKGSIDTLTQAINKLTEQSKNGFKVTATCNCNCANCNQNCAGNGSGNGGGSSSGGSSSSGGGNTSGGGSTSGGSNISGGTSGGNTSSGSSNNTKIDTDSSLSSLRPLLNGDIGDRWMRWSSSDQSIGREFYSGPGISAEDSDLYKESAKKNTFTSSMMYVGISDGEYDEIKKQGGAYNVGKKLGLSLENALVSDTSGNRFVVVSPSSPIASIIKDAYKSRLLAKGYEMGGMPNSGELFVARENGTPEMVGSIGGHTAVANANTQIVSAVAAGVSQSNEAVVTAINNASSDVVTAIDNKDTSVRIGDREIAQANNRGQRQLGRNLMS